MNSRSVRWIALAIILVLGCNRGPDEGRRVSSSSTPGAPPAGGGQMNGSLPEGHPPVGDQSGSAPAPTGADVDPHALPLKEQGSGSLSELNRAQAGTKNPAAAAAFADAFHLTFTSDQSARNYPRARDLYQQALRLDPKFAEAYRGLAYAEFNIGFNADAALMNYEKAIELKPDYGEAHYALSFMCAMDPSNQANMAKGAEHFKRAMELGVEDERNLGQRFYPNVKIETH